MRNGEKPADLLADAHNDRFGATFRSTLEHQAEGFAKVKDAGIQEFNGSESMAETAGILSQHP